MIHLDNSVATKICLDNEWYTYTDLYKYITWNENQIYNMASEWLSSYE